MAPQSGELFEDRDDLLYGWSQFYSGGMLVLRLDARGVPARIMIGVAVACQVLVCFRSHFGSSTGHANRLLFLCICMIL